MKILTEAALDLADGQSITAFLRTLAEAAIAKVVPLLPAPTAREDGGLPYQYVTMEDATDTQVVVRAVRYGGEADSFRRCFSAPYTVAAGVPTVGGVTEVQARVVYEPITAASPMTEAVQALRRRIRGALWSTTEERAGAERDADALISQLPAGTEREALTEELAALRDGDVARLTESAP